MKQSMIIPVAILLAGCATHGTDRRQVLDDVNAVSVVAVVKLAEAQVDGNWPVVQQGADVKKEVAIDKRVYTRGQIELRGTVLRCLKGNCPTNQISFNILTPLLVSDRDGELLKVPASNIPNLKIGENYVVMLDPINSSNLYFTSVWPVGSPEAVLVQDHLKGNGASNTASHGTALPRRP